VCKHALEIDFDASQFHFRCSHSRTMDNEQQLETENKQGLKGYLQIFIINCRLSDDSLLALGLDPAQAFTAYTLTSQLLLGLFHGQNEASKLTAGSVNGQQN